MKSEILQQWGGITISTLARYVLPADVAPPPEQTAALTLGVLCMLGLIVAFIVAISVVVIRAIRRSHTPKDDI